MTKNSINNTASSLQVSAINITGSTISTTTTNTNLSLTPNGTGKVSISGAYTLPNTDGTSSQVLSTNGSSSLSFSTLASYITTINVQVFTATGTYTPTTGMTQCMIELVGGGGGGGGTQATGATTCSGGAGGGGGGYSKGLFTAAQIGVSKAVTIGAGGVGGNGGTAVTGGTTSVGALITANGGAGASLSTVGAVIYGFGGNSGVGSGGFLNCNGTPGEPAIGLALAAAGVNGFLRGGAGGKSVLGGAAREQSIPSSGVTAFAGWSAFGYGGGGGGGTSPKSKAAQVGGNGNSGVVIITEYII